MTRHFRYKDAKSQKFWEITLIDTTVRTRYGKIGSGGQEAAKSFDSATLAQKEYDKLILEKTVKGYVEQTVDSGGSSGPGDSPATTSPKNSPGHTTPFVVMSAQELFKKHGKAISREFKRDYDENSPYPALVYVGDAHIAGHLSLQGYTCEQFGVTPTAKTDSDEEEDVTPGVIVVIGDLTVHGNLVDCNVPGPFFYVTGTLRAHNLVCGDSTIRIDGDVRVEGVTLGNYNDGSAIFGGTLFTAWFDEENHHFEYKDLEVTHTKTIEQMTKAGFFPALVEEYSDILNIIVDGGSPLITAKPAPAKSTPNAEYQFWIDTVTKRGRKLKNVPAKFLDEKLILAAIQGDYADDVYPHIPNAHMTRSLLRTVAQATTKGIINFTNDLWTPEIVALVKTHDNWALSNIPLPFRTQEICFDAARLGKCRIADIPAEHLDEPMILEVLRGSKSEIERVPERYINTPIIAEPLKQGHLFLPYGWRFEKYFNALHIDPDDAALLVVNASLESFDKLPGVFVTEKIYKAAEAKYSKGATAAAWEQCKARHNTDAPHDWNKDFVFVKSVWRIHWTQEYFEAIAKKIYAGSTQAGFIRFVPPEFFSETTTWRILKSDQHNMKYLPQQALTAEMCLYDVRQSPYSLNDVPVELMNEAIALAGVDKVDTPYGKSDGSGGYLKYVPIECRTLAVCKAALNRDSARQYIPPYILTQLK